MKTVINLLAAMVAMGLIGCASFHKGSFFEDREPPKHGQFRHVKFVSASATSTYYFGMAATRADIYQQAHRQLVENAGLEGTNRQLVNLTVETYSVFFVVSFTKTVMLTAEVIEVPAEVAPPAALTE